MAPFNRSTPEYECYGALFSTLEHVAQELMKRKMKICPRRGTVPKNTPVNDPKAVERIVPPRCAMQGPIRGEAAFMSAATQTR